MVVALTREVRAVASAPPAVTVIGAPGGGGSGGGGSGAWGLLRPSLVVVAGVGLGAAYVRSRGLRAADLTWVSRSSFEGTVEALRGSLGRLAGVIGSTKRELGERLGRVEGAVDAAAVDLRALVEADVGGRVTEVGNALEGMRADMDELRSEVHGLGGDVASITRGLGLLCTVVGVVSRARRLPRGCSARPPRPCRPRPPRWPPPRLLRQAAASAPSCPPPP